MPTPLGELMFQIEVPDSQTARRDFFARGTHRSRRRGAVVATVLMAAFLISPPGQGALAWVGEQVGIGDPATVPERSWPSPTGEPSDFGAGTVIGSGETPTGEPYELVVTDPPGSDSCVFLDFPGRSLESGPGSCWSPGQLPGPGEIEPPSFSIADPDAERPPAVDAGREVLQYAFGLAPPETEAVHIRVRARDEALPTISASVHPASGDLAEAAGAAEDLVPYVAFLPPDSGKVYFARGGTLEVEALDSTGRVVASAGRAGPS